MALSPILIAHVILATLDLMEVPALLALSTHSRTALGPQLAPHARQTVAMLRQARLRRISASAYLVTRIHRADVSNARLDTSKPFTAQQRAARAHLAITFLQLCSFLRCV